ncbi:NAD(P)H-quinone oxidoreductase subunit L, chloroplastic [Abrus precatorius]|uniref:NAD(P)H-quinone oxidoreductase subunit L, chloroplastic n=1 Tax=Abrus precatorius TaxID=3816 RepID=A0A8B8KDF1_ABRPR|nr:NAD(P)H-quinone oxidoreductase subunit L, chloroplastic [Abrus precatorius]
MKRIRNQTERAYTKMSYSFSLHVPKALPPLPTSARGASSLFIASEHKSNHNNTNPCRSLHRITCSSQKPNDYDSLKKPSLALHIGALLALAEQPVLAVTGENNQPELTWVLTQWGIVLFIYFIVVPPIIMYWLWKRWYRRKLLEMYLQFMCVFIFFPGVLLWAPFLNYRKFPRDPSLKYPWSTPEDPSKIRNAYSKYPFAEPEDYDYP